MAPSAMQQTAAVSSSLLSQEKKAHDEVAREVISALSSQLKARDEAQMDLLQTALKKALDEQRVALTSAANLSNSTERGPLIQSDDAAGNVVTLEAVKDVRDRQAKLITEIKEAHARQMEILRGAIAEEREENSHAQKVFEQTLHIKYDHLVSALQEKIKAEHDARMQRALDDLEKVR